MTRMYSTALVYLRALATVESRTALTLHHMSRTPTHRLIVALGSILPTRLSSGLTCKSLHFYNIRPLNLQPLQHQPQHFTFDLAREGLDFSIWNIRVADGLSQAQYENIRQMVEDGLNTQAAAGSVSRDALVTQGDQGPLFDSAADTASVEMSADQQEARIKVVAMYDADVELNAPKACKLFFSYPVGKDPTTALSVLRRKNGRLLALSKTIPVVDALRDVGDSAQ